MNYQLQHVPANPQCKYLSNVQIDLLCEEGLCLQNITRDRSNGFVYLKNANFTQAGMALRDGLLAIPGVTELSFYQNWERCGRRVFIIFSEAIMWEELWAFIEPFLTLLFASTPKEQITQHLETAKAALDIPVLAVERCPNDQHFVIHTRTQVYNGIIACLKGEKGERFMISGNQEKLLTSLAPALSEIAHDKEISEIGVNAYQINFKVEPRARERLIACAVPLVGKALFPNAVCMMRTYTRQYNEPDPRDDWDEGLDFLDGRY